MVFSAQDITAIVLTLKLATTVTLLLLLFSTPVAWWLSQTTSRWKGPISALVALPLIMPPTVLGFYLLLAMGPHGVIGKITTTLGLGTLPFSFAGLVVASMLYSLPFVVQPLQNAFAAIPQGALEAAATLRSGPWDRFVHIALPLARPGFISAGILGFAHTVGEFGVVLMIGGNIPGKTQVISVQIYEQVESLNYAQAQGLALAMVIFSFVVLLTVYTFFTHSPFNSPLATARPRGSHSR